MLFYWFMYFEPSLNSRNKTFSIVIYHPFNIFFNSTWIPLKLWFFQRSCMGVRVGLWRKLSTEELMLWIVALEKTLESPLDCKEIQPIHPKGYQSWVFIGRTDVEAETPILWPPDVRSWLIWKDPDAVRDWGREEKGTTQDEMVGWHHWLDGHGFGWTPAVGDGQGGLACCSSWSHKESDTTESLNWLTDWTCCLNSIS